MLSDLMTAMICETWAMRPDWLCRLAVTVETLDAAADYVKTPRKLPKIQGSVAVLPMFGMITQRDSVWQDVFGGVSTESLGAAFTAAINHPKVGAVLLDVDSPGGTISGVPELADIIYRGAQIKPVAAISNSQMASAAYWLGSQVGANKKALVASPSAEVGSIGVYRMHEDYSERMAQDGIKVSFLAVPEFKTEANPYEPLSEEARQHHMQQVQAGYESFVFAVARGRSVSKTAVKGEFGKGRMFGADDATTMGLVDRVATRNQLLSEMTGTRLDAMEASVLQDDMRHAWVQAMPQQLIDPKETARREAMQKRLRYFIREQPVAMSNDAAT